MSVRHHQIGLTITCADEDWATLLRTVTNVISERYRAVMVPGTFAVHADAHDAYRWTWQTTQPQERDADE